MSALAGAPVPLTSVSVATPPNSCRSAASQPAIASCATWVKPAGAVGATRNATVVGVVPPVARIAAPEDRHHRDRLGLDGGGVLGLSGRAGQGRGEDDGDRGGRLLGDRQGLRDDVLRRPRALRLRERRVRAVRPRQRPPARHLSERHEVRGRDHRHDPRPHARRRGDRRRPGRAWSPPAAPAASCTPCSPTASTAANAAASPSGPTSSSPRPPTPPSTRAATCSAWRCAMRRSIP